MKKTSKENSSYHTKEFLELRDQWYKKLADEGFNDIELHSESPEPSVDKRGRYRPLLKRYTCSAKEKQLIISNQDSAEYFRLAAQYLNSPFLSIDALQKHAQLLKKTKKSFSHRIPTPSTIEKIWELHSEGMSLPEIGEQLDLKKGSLLGIIAFLRSKMKTHFVDHQTDEDIFEVDDKGNIL